MSDRRNFKIAANINWVAIAKLQEANRKTRRHGLNKIKKLAASIADTGYFNPILVTENFEIIAGHARLEVAKRLGMDEVPVIVISGLSEGSKRALRLADNRLVLEANWDRDALALELTEIINMRQDLELTGFDPIEVDRILLPPTLTLEDPEEELPGLPDVPVSRLGDRWACSGHLLICGDARDPGVYDAALWGEKADMVISDAPYNTVIEDNVSGRGKVKHGNFVAASGEMSPEEYLDFLKSVMLLLRHHSRNGAVHDYFIDWRHIADMIAAGTAVFSELLNICVWVKTNGGLGSFYRSQHEFVAVFKNGDAAPINNIQLGRMGRYRSNVWTYAGATANTASRKRDLADHPTVKPLAMVADAIRDVTAPGDLVLDPFGGSGTTLLAAEVTKRRAVLIELDPKYVDVTLKRFQRQTGIEPVLLPERIPLSDIKQQRIATDG